jgi:hypothetical protein
MSGRGFFHSFADLLRRTVKRRGGRGLLQFIGRGVPRPLNAWIRRRIFLGAYAPTVAEVVTAFWRRPGCRSSTWKPPTALRTPTRALEPTVHRGAGTQTAMCGDDSSWRGNCIAQGPRRRSLPAGCNCFRSSLLPANLGPPFLTRAPLYEILIQGGCASDHRGSPR